MVIMHKYVITMPANKKRMAQFYEEMQRISWDDVEKIEWVWWETYVQYELFPWTHPRNVWNYLSHLKVLSDAIKKWYDDIIVMEDDLILTNYFVSQFSWYMWRVPNDWEMLRLSWFPSPEMQRKQAWPWRLYDTGPRWTEMYRVRWEWIQKLYDYLSEHWPVCPIDWVIHKAPLISYITAYSLWMQHLPPW